MFHLALASGSALLPSGLFRNFRYDNPDEQNYVRQVFQLAHKKAAKVHVLKIDGTPCGFVALSIDNFNDVPSIVIEYLFTSVPYRKQIYPELGEPPIKISEYLIGQALLMAADIATKVPLRYIALQLATDRHEALYSSHGFIRTEGTNWMSQIIPSV
jgi:hypothetical protein